MKQGSSWKDFPYGLLILIDRGVSLPISHLENLVDQRKLLDYLRDLPDRPQTLSHIPDEDIEEFLNYIYHSGVANQYDINKTYAINGNGLCWLVQMAIEYIMANRRG